MKRTALLAGILAFVLCLSPAALAEGEAGMNTATPNSAPVAENQEIETYRGVSVGGRLAACDPNGDKVTFQITTKPMKGDVELSDDGYFVYTPQEGKRGRDYFGYRATDSEGNVSQEATVIIRLCKQKTAVTYSDLEGSGTEYAAVVLAEKGIFVGEKVGDSYVFNPNQAVTRGEFLSMCMELDGKDVLKGVSSTGFLDDGEISSWLKPYVSTALLHGYIRGTAVAGGAKFCPDDKVLLRDACTMLNAVLNVTDVISAAAYVGDDNASNAWAQAVANLSACSVLDANYGDMASTVTRADAAQMLSNALSVVQAR
jgi:S-layer homology domain.